MELAELQPSFNLIKDEIAATVYNQQLARVFEKRLPDQQFRLEQDYIYVDQFGSFPA